DLAARCGRARRAGIGGRARRRCRRVRRAAAGRTTGRRVRRARDVVAGAGRRIGAPRSARLAGVSRVAQGRSGARGARARRARGRQPPADGLRRDLGDGGAAAALDRRRRRDTRRAAGLDRATGRRARGDGRAVALPAAGEDGVGGAALPGGRASARVRVGPGRDVRGHRVDARRARPGPLIRRNPRNFETRSAAAGTNPLNELPDPEISRAPPLLRRHRMRNLAWLGGVVLALSCTVNSSNLNVDASGIGAGGSAAGGSPGTGGQIVTGGTTGTGGQTATGGTIGTGGQTATGGHFGTGGRFGAGGQI